MSALLAAQSVVMDDVTCANCSITFWAPRSFIKARRDDGKTFYCPSGHSNVYRESHASRLQKQLDHERSLREQAERQLEWARAQAKNDRTQRTRAHNKLKRVTARVNAGVCIHCNRTFKQLAAHMKTQHPDVAMTPERVCNHEDNAN